MKHLYKSQLQIYAQKRNLELPVYSVESVGPCHASKFRCGVIFQGKRFETKELFHTAKEAEYAAAKVALDSITPVETKEEDPFIYKNLVQEILQKEHAGLPKYTTVRTGKPHIPSFMSAVEVKGETFRGEEAHTKKQAELNAAKVAYIAFKERRCLTWAGQFRTDDNLEGATNHIMETPRNSSATIPVFGACNSSRTVRTDAQPFPDKQNKREGEGPKATPNPFTRMQFPATTIIPGEGPNATPSPFTRMHVAAATTISGKGPNATPNPFTRMHISATTTIPYNIQTLKVASSVPRPISYPKTPPITVMNSQLVGPSSSDRMKMKRKMLVFPQSGSTSPEDVNPVIHDPKELKMSPGPRSGPEPGPIARAPTNILAQLPSPDPCECPLHRNKKLIALIPKEET